MTSADQSDIYLTITFKLIAANYLYLNNQTLINKVSSDLDLDFSSNGCLSCMAGGPLHG